MRRYRTKGLYNRCQKMVYDAVHPLSSVKRKLSAVRFLEAIGAPTGMQRRLRRKFLRMKQWIDQNVPW